MVAKQAVKRTAAKTGGRKPTKALKQQFAKQALADIKAIAKAQKKLDLELKRVEKHIRKLLGHQYLF